MPKIFRLIGFLTACLIIFSSCNRFLRPSAKQRNPNKNTNTTAGNSGYDMGDAFKGTAIKDVTYTSSISYNGNSQQLGLDIYKPANAAGKKFPAVILIHGGSFIGGNKKGLASTCSKLANNGYVAISIDYRLGWGFVSKASFTCSDTVKLKKAIYRAVQDAHSALNFIAAHADEYNIDRNAIYIGGQSAGAITALTAAYLKPDEVNAFFSDKVVQDLGSLFTDATASYTLKGVISMWGAFVNPQLITKKTALPTIFFQGQLDKAVPFDTRAFTPCPSSTMVYGTLPLYNRLKSLGELTIAHVDPKGGHGVFEENFRIDNILCFLNDVQQGVKKQVYLTGVVNSCDKQ